MSDFEQSPGLVSSSEGRCVPNISTRERRKRLLFGVVSLVLALAALLAMVSVEASAWWRLALFPLFVGAASGFFQWRDKT